MRTIIIGYMLIDTRILPLLAKSDWRSPQLTVRDSGNTLTFHIQDAFNYHGYDAVGGVVLGFRLLQRAIALLSPNAPPERRELTLFTAFPGLGARDCFELVSRMVSGDRFALDTQFINTTAQAGVEGRLHFDFGYRGQHVVLAPIEGAPSAEFIALGKASKLPGVSAQQQADWQRAKYAFANTLLAADPGEVIRVL